VGTLVTIAICWIAASYVLAIVLVADQMRRPLHDWEAAGRDRRFWVSLALLAGFHGLGQYAAAAYLTGVRPRFRRTEQQPGRRQPLRRMNAAFDLRWQPAETDVARRWHVANLRRPKTAAEELALLAAVLVFAASIVHAVLTADHFEQYWLFGVLFAVATCLQAGWTALVYSAPLVTRRLLIAGAAGNAALVVAWTLSTTAGLPLGPRPWKPEGIDAVGVLATADELIAVILLLAALGCMRSRRPSIAPIALRLAAAVAGVLFLYTVLSPFTGGHDH